MVQGKAGFHVVTAMLLRPGVNSLRFLTAPDDIGPWPGYRAGMYFTFPTDSQHGPVFSSPTLAPLLGLTYSYQ